MVTLRLLYISTSLITAVICLLLTGIAFYQRGRPGAKALAWAMFGVSGWCLFPGLGLLSKSTEVAYLITRTAYIFFAVTPVLWLKFTYEYTRRQSQANPLLVNLLWIGPLISLTLLWTNDWHHLFWAELQYFWSDGFVSWKAVFGPGFWFHSIYSYTLMLIGVFIVIRYSITNFAIYRLQTIALLIGSIAPILTSLPAVVGLTTVSLTPFGLVITGVVYTWAVLDTGLLDLRPIARNLLVEQMQDGMIIVDDQNKIIDVNPPALKLLGGNEKEIIGSSANKVLKKLVGRDVQLHSLTSLRTEITLQLNRQQQHFLLILTPLFDAADQSIGHLLHMQDITGLKQVEKALRASESHARAIIAALPDSVHQIDLDGFFLNSYEPEEQNRTSLFDIFSLPLATKMLDTVRATMQTGKCQTLTYSLCKEDGDERWFEARTAPLIGENGQPSSVVWIDRETTEQVHLYHEIERLANTDALTGLANRRHFMNTTQAFVEHNGPSQTPCAFILIDVDHFKEVNDKRGHVFGDEVLQMVASRLQKQVRSQDTVSRYGGEEFAVFLPHVGEAEAEQVAQRLCRSVCAQPFQVDDETLSLSISVGMVSILVDNNLKIEEMIKKADDALYEAKRAGRNTVKKFIES
jgi:diguanylate cyclase (GGDEF)-like protein/PAS domain S-box-containing protein